MRGKFFYVFWYTSNGDDEGFYIRANSAKEIWDALEAKYVDADEYIEVMEANRFPNKWAYIKNGRIMYTDEDYGPVEVEIDFLTEKEEEE